MRMARYFLAVVVVFALLAVFVPPQAYAGLEFCSTDPIFKVDGKTVRVVVNIAPGSLLHATWPEPIEVKLTAPKGTHPRVVATPGPLPVTASAKEKGKHAVKVKVEIPEVEGYQGMEVRVFVGGEQVAYGTTTDDELEVTFGW